MSTEYPKVTLGSICTITAGQSPKASYYNDEGHGLPFYQGKKEFTKRYLGKPSVWTKETTKEAQPGDILMSVRAPVGPINEAVEKICIGRGLASIRPGPNILKDYLWFALLWLQPEITGHSGAVFNSINKAGIEALIVPLPPLDEQKRIVSILDQAFEGLDRARANAEANLESAREMFDSSVEQLINPPDGTFEERRFGDLLDFLNGHAFKSGDSVRASNVQVLRMGNLYRNQLDIDRGAVFYPENFKTQYEKYALKAGDVVLTLTGTSGKKDYGFAVEIPVVQRTLLLNQRIAKLIVVAHDRIDLSFMVFQLRSKSFLDRLYSSANGTRQANLSTAAIKEFMIKVPPMHKQKEIASKLLDLSQNIDEMKTGLETKLNDLMQLRESLLQKAFSGELT